jgi:hypothetical protein
MTVAAAVGATPFGAFAAATYGDNVDTKLIWGDEKYSMKANQQIQLR